MKRHNVAEIFKKYRRQLFSFIRYRTSEDEAEDILQDVFLRFIQADNVSPINQVSSWLFQTARNKIIDNGRKCKEERMPEIVIQQDGDTFMQQVTDFLIDEEQSPEKEYLKSVVWENWKKLIYELPEEQRYVFEPNWNEWPYIYRIYPKCVRRREYFDFSENIMPSDIFVSGLKISMNH